MTKGLASKRETVEDFNSFVKLAFGPAEKTERSLQTKLEALSEQDLNTVMQTARLVKITSGITNRAKSYDKLVKSMYPKLSFYLRSLIAEMLQQADPIQEAPEVEVKRNNLDFRSPAQKLSDEKKTMDTIIKDIMNDLGHGDLYETKEEQEKVKKGSRYAAYSTPAGEIDPFLEKLALAESSGDTEAEIKIKD